VIHKRGASLLTTAYVEANIHETAVLLSEVNTLIDRKAKPIFALFQRFVSHVRSTETNPKQNNFVLFWVCFGFVLRCFVSVVRAT